MPVSPKERGNCLSTLASWLHAEEKLNVQELLLSSAMHQHGARGLPPGIPAGADHEPTFPSSCFPPSPSRVQFLCLPPAPQPGIGEGFPSLQLVGRCWFATGEPVSTSCGWLLC